MFIQTPTCLLGYHAESDHFALSPFQSKMHIKEGKTLLGTVRWLRVWTCNCRGDCNVLLSPMLLVLSVAYAIECFFVWVKQIATSVENACLENSTNWECRNKLKKFSSERIWNNLKIWERGESLLAPLTLKSFVIHHRI